MHIPAETVLLTEVAWKSCAYHVLYMNTRVSRTFARAVCYQGIDVEKLELNVNTRRHYLAGSLSDQPNWGLGHASGQIETEFWIGSELCQALGVSQA